MTENNTQAVAKTEPRKSLVATLAAQYDMEPQPFMDAIAQTVMPHDRQISNAMIAAFLMVCNEHGLNPFTREIFAFPTKSGGIQPIVSIDGWLKLIIQHPQYQGMDIQMTVDEKTNKPVSCTCTIYRKDREHSTPITEYFDECYRDTDPWKKMPKRMLRHKAIKEAGRYTFGFAGIMDEDEAIDAINVTAESTVMARETMSKAEALKEKIGAKKAEKKEEPKPQPKPEAPVEEPVIITDADIPFDNAPASSPAETEAELLNEIKAPTPVEEDQERPLTEVERNSIIAILKTKITDDASSARVMNAARKKFMEFGAKSTKELKLKDLNACINWAKELQA